MNRTVKLIILDIIGCTFALYLSFFLRFEFVIPNTLLSTINMWLPIFLSWHAIILYFSGIYFRIYRYTTLIDAFAILKSASLAFVLAILTLMFLFSSVLYPRSVLLIFYLLSMVSLLAIRISVRIYFTYYFDIKKNKNRIKRKKLILIGAGSTGEKIAREILETDRDKYEIVGFIDDDINKRSRLLHGIKVIGDVDDIAKIKINFDEFLITAPSATGDQMRKIISICGFTGKKYKTLPSLNEIIDGSFSIASIRNVSYLDLLGREEVKLDNNSIDTLLFNKRILITGAGGSIGAELVKQCLVFNPSEIICLDNNEEKIFHIEHRLKNNSKKTVLASIDRKDEVERAFIENRPQVVFHAAAFKHVPIQESHPWCAVRTNVGGSLNLIELSDSFDIELFVLVSTDKAVNPVNIMGATKRVSEKIIQSFNHTSNTKFMAVRFGNVIGSSGSAIPIFERQIREGGPVTITHPDMTRYFMSIQEASQLILQCGAIGNSGEIFLLEMGKPIKILQMAKDLISLSGLKPDIDIPIVFTGLRPGEKLYEELQLTNEKKIKTKHKKITILKNDSVIESWEKMKSQINILLDSRNLLDYQLIQNNLKYLAPNYNPPNFDQAIIKPVLKFDKIKVEA